ncbi:beta-1,6-N-acetylglucosaminyltransferase [Mucilaginibacter robiniae]|uniref:Peptide O-xylosyltransferase n=1 Tax=Mucilaginibacter robiniae TaxID=2728022 RepID=A0A7L5E350_9SPHI|nr:beta-1,6-N-acetylglucosaminyltransferase [Mucilaginibacter robiniae]QJD97555.1 beta-1,6-N-acetylglucosaminyltransferase [Mucilaginibacter robiniae]
MLNYIVLTSKIYIIFAVQNFISLTLTSIIYIMRIAILMLAHKNIEQLDRLLNRLTQDFDVYLHLDQKWQINEKHFDKYTNVFLTKRYTINWGSYQQVQADAELFTQAFKKNYDYYLLISGQDIPIKSNKQIITFLEENKNVSFVDHEAFPKKAWANAFDGGYTRVIYYYGFDFKKNFTGLVLKKALALVRHIQKLTGIKRKLQPLKYYGGWNWVNLNRSAMTHIVTYLEKHPEFLESFKYTLCGDEVWIQTVLMNSDNKVINKELRYTEWIPGAENPKTITMQSFDNIKTSEALFARKFEPDVDAAIIDKVYELTA